MLRLVCIVICLGLLLVTLIAALFGSPLVWPGIVTPLVVLLGLVFERWRYAKLQQHAPSRFEATDERFADPESGNIVEVYFDRESGERRYIDSGVPGKSP
jgi:hypothetical protein